MNNQSERDKTRHRFNCFDDHITKRNENSFENMFDLNFVTTTAATVAATIIITKLVLSQCKTENK